MKLQDYINKHGNRDINEDVLNALLEINNHKPKNGQKYNFIGDDGLIDSCLWLDDPTDIARYALGNCFETEEQAKYVRECLHVTAELKLYAEEHNECKINWNNSNQEKWCIYYDNRYECIRCDYYLHSQKIDIYFTSSEIAEKAVQAIGAERVKKFYLGVKE